MLRIGIVGVTGRLGKEVLAACQADNSSEYVFGITSTKDKENTALKIYNSFPDIPIDILIDCSLPKALPITIMEATKRKIPLLVLSTGHDSISKNEYKIPVCFASNASFGVFVLNEAAKLISKYVSQNAEILIDETHHNQKKDSPSGTARTIAENIKEASGYETQILSKRAGTVIGDHKILFYLDGEHIELTHIAESRSLFGKGAIRLAHMLSKVREPKVYSIKELYG